MNATLWKEVSFHLQPFLMHICLWYWRKLCQNGLSFICGKVKPQLYNDDPVTPVDSHYISAMVSTCCSSSHLSLSLFFFLIFNWRIINLQNFVVFFHITKINHRYTHVPSFPSPSPSNPSACHRAPVWIPWVIQQIPIGYLFYIWHHKFPRYSLHTTHPLPPPLCPCP